MKKFIFYLLSIFLITTNLFAQDPEFEWAVRVGGQSPDYCNDMVIDTGGNTYTTGCFTGSIDIDPGSGIMYLNSNGMYDAYILKLDPSGNFLWARSFGGSNHDIIYSIDFDSYGNIYVVGNFYSAVVDFDPGPGIYNLSLSGTSNAFILKLNSDGNFVWAKSFQGSPMITAVSCKLDSNDEIIITGTFYYFADLDPGIGTYNLTSNGYKDIYIAKLDSTGSFIWAKSVGGTGEDRPWDMCLGSNRNIYLTGDFRNTVDFDPGIGIYYLSSNGERDIYILKIDNLGNLVWAKTVGGNLDDAGYHLDLDENSNVYLSGYFRNMVDFDPDSIGTHYISSSGNSDAYLSKLDSMGDFIWVSSFGSINSDCGGPIVVDITNCIYVTTRFENTVDFDMGIGTYNLTSNGMEDICLMKMDQNGNLSWANSFGGINDEEIRTMILGNSGEIYLSGVFRNSTVDFDPGPNVYNMSTIGHFDGYILKMNQCITSNNYISNVSCDQYNFNGIFLANSGIYSDTLENNTGCDSIITLNLTIVEIDTLVTLLANEFTANSTGTDYQWIDCQNANVLIQGATYQNFAPIQNGSYAVIITDNGCIDTSSCHTLSTIANIEIDTQLIALPMQWSLFSTYIDPVFPTMDSVMSDIVPFITIVKDGDGLTYWPQYGVNLIGSLNFMKGYQIKLISTQTLQVIGLKIQPEINPIPLAAGWSMIAYLRDSPLSTVTAFSSFSNLIELVKNGNGLVYWPIFGLNNIGNLYPGQGYQIKMNTAHSLIYPPN